MLERLGLWASVNALVRPRNLQPHGTQQDTTQSVPSGTIYNQLAILTDGGECVVCINVELESLCLCNIGLYPTAPALARTLTRRLYVQADTSAQ